MRHRRWGAGHNKFVPMGHKKTPAAPAFAIVLFGNGSGSSDYRKPIDEIGVYVRHLLPCTIDFDPKTNGNPSR